MDLLIPFSAVRAETLRKVAALNQKQLDFEPQPGRWSIGEVLDHLLLAEALWRLEIAELIALKRAGRTPYRKRTFADVNVSPFGMPDALLPLLEAPLAMMNAMTPAFVRTFVLEHPVLPFRNPSRATPRRCRPAAELRGELLSSLDDTRHLLARNADLDFSEMVTEHPLIGASNVPAILSFLASHERRHQRQIERVRSDRRFPPS